MMKIIKLFVRLMVGILKALLKLIAIFVVLAFVFGVKVSFYITAFIVLVISMLFISNLLNVFLEQNGSSEITDNRDEFYDPDEYDHWVLGMPAVTQKAYKQGFFHDHDDQI